MEHLKKIIAFIAISCLAASAPANASGFIYHWDSFAVAPDLMILHTDKKPTAQSLPVPDLKETPLLESSKEKLLLFDDQNTSSRTVPEKKSALDNIRIDFFSAGGFLPNKREISPNGNDEQVAKLMDAVKSLINNDSKIRSMETIGGIIEPQINFYFEF